uniref:Transglycosylase SLT domain-containing protein n=1 Tax=Bicosoecida sp. CB-2014 TaxID=1486930 RepID=A0A7S1CL10_9STRA
MAPTMASVGVAALALLALASGAAAAESCGFMKSLISSNLPGNEDIWLCIAFKESSYNPYARNPFSGATGLFQVEPIHCGDPDCPPPGGNCVSALEDPGTNARCAASVYRSQGFGAWTTSSECMSGQSPCSGGGGGGGGGGGCNMCSQIRNCQHFGGGNACYSKYGCQPGSC